MISRQRKFGKSPRLYPAYSRSFFVFFPLLLSAGEMKKNKLLLVEHAYVVAAKVVAKISRGGERAKNIKQNTYTRFAPTVLVSLSYLKSSKCLVGQVEPGNDKFYKHKLSSVLAWSQ